jgi:hypothetical protein
MIGKLPKSKAWKQSDPDMPGLLVHPRYSSRDSLSEFIGFLWIPTELPHSSKLDLRNPIRPPKDSGISSVLELQGGLPTGQEALRPSEPQHSPDKATPSYYTKNGSFSSGISKI